MGNPLRGWAEDPQGAAAQFAESPHVVGVAVAGIRGGVATVAVAGLADADSGAALTTDHVLRTGSVTKMLTATLVMQCVDDGLVDLDDPVVAHVPGFRLAEAGAAESIRVRHLLSHTSGIDATDLFVDTGNDDDAIERYVERLADVGLLTTPGEVFSYNNAGIVLAGHLVARVRGTTWEEALQARVLQPLGMTSTGFVTGRLEGDPALVARLARSHLAGPAGVTALPPAAGEPTWTRGLAPAGSLTVTTAGDLARFVLSHLGAAGVPPVVRPETAALMRERVIDAPGGVVQMAGSGLGWQTWQSGDLAYVRHSGAHAGQSAVIAVDPSEGVGVVVLTNSLNGHTAMSQVLDTVPVPWPSEPAPADLSPYAGRYGAGSIGEVVISVADGGGLEATLPALGRKVPLWAVDRGSFLGTGGACAFFGFAGDGAPQYMRFQMRALRLRPD